MRDSSPAIVEARAWRAPGNRVTVAAALAVLVLGLSWALLHTPLYAGGQIVDTPLYQRYGEAIADGALPYRDFALEYPPAALPVFLLPALGQGRQSEESYRRWFELVMLTCAVAVVAAVAVALAALGAASRRLTGALAFTALAPLALGSVVLTRFDLWPAALTAAALAAVLHGRSRLGFAVLGLAAAAKLYPAAVLPLALAFVWRRRGRREAYACAASFLAVAAVCFVPFAVLAPEGLWDSISRQLERPLQIESLGAAILVAVHHVSGFGLEVETSAGSQNLAGSAPAAVALLQVVLQAGVLLGIWIWFARRPRTADEFVTAAAAAVCASLALGKVLSPQFLLWLLPLVPLVAGRRGVAAGALFGGALVLTQLWFPSRYWDYALEFDPAASWLVLARDVLLIALLASLVVRPRAAPRPAAV